MTSSLHVVADSGPLIVLAKLHVPFLLSALYEKVHIPSSVYEEAVLRGLRQGYEDARILQAFLREKGWQPEEVLLTNLPPLLRNAHLDRGEHDALALALYLRKSLVLMDEYRGRVIARQLGLPVRGSLGILVQAYRQNILQQEQLHWYLLELERRDDIWINPRLIQRVREEVLGIPGAGDT